MWDVMREIAKNTDEIDEVKVECYDQADYGVSTRELVEVLQNFKKIDRLVIKVKQTLSGLDLLAGLPIRSLSLTIETDHLRMIEEFSSFIKKPLHVEELYIKFPEMDHSIPTLVEAIQANQELKVSLIRY